MPHLSALYPGDMPEFISRRPAPREWQERVQDMDDDLWVAWNPHHQDGPRWSIMRFVGSRPGRGGVPLLERGGSNGEDSLLKAIRAGWSFVQSLSWPDGTAADLSDMHILALFRNDYFRKYGRDEGHAHEKIKAERKGDIAARDATHKASMKDAWADTMSDKAIVANATSAVMPGGTE